MRRWRSVTDPGEVEAMVAEVVGAWGGVDILVNNAGILRDKTFAKMALDDFRLVVEVHLMGAVHCTKAVWNMMRERGYGRIVFTTSSSGLFGNFGQSNYGAAKMALVGLMQTLALEGAKADIRVNCLAPSAATRMLEGLMPAESLAALAPEAVSPAILALVGDDAPTRTILCAGAGSFEQAHITLTRGVHLGRGPDVAERLLASLDAVGALEEMTIPANGFEQPELELTKAGLSLGAEQIP
jgi:NAD(P)-dependent dehydrogenase (short-subunit alcohol dehydrogenase family)